MSSANIDALRKLVEEVVAFVPHELDGFQWAVFNQQTLADTLEISTATIRRITAKPPFVRQSKQIDGKKSFLLRIGEPGPVTVRHVANIMSKIWRNWLQQREEQLHEERAKLLSAMSGAATGAEKEKILKKITVVNEELKRLWTRTTRAEYGCMNGLAEVWPDGFQVKMFEMVIKDWSQFMLGVKWLAIEEEWPDLALIDRYLKYPSIKLIRKAHKAAVEMLQIEVQDAGTKAPAWMQAAVAQLPKADAKSG